MAFRETVKRLARALRESGARYCVLGPLASGYYGIPRSVKEIEVLIFPSWVIIKQLVSKLRKSGFKLLDEVKQELDDFRMEAEEGFRVKLRMARTQEDLSTIKNGKSARFFGTAIRLAPPEALIARALAEGGVKGVTDAIGILVRCKGKLDEKYLRQSAESFGIWEDLNRLMKKLE